MGSGEKSNKFKSAKKLISMKEKVKMYHIEKVREKKQKSKLLKMNDINFISNMCKKNKINKKEK